MNYAEQARKQFEGIDRYFADLITEAHDIDPEAVVRRLREDEYPRTADAIEQAFRR